MSVTESVAFQDSSTSKRYRFVVTGHGKYEKVSMDACEDSNCQSGKTRDFCFHFYFKSTTEMWGLVMGFHFFVN